MRSTENLYDISKGSCYNLKLQSISDAKRFKDKNNLYNLAFGIGVYEKSLKDYSITIGSKAQRFKRSSCINSGNILVYLYSPVDKVNSINLNDISHESRFNLETWDWSN